MLCQNLLVLAILWSLLLDWGQITQTFQTENNRSMRPGLLCFLRAYCVVGDLLFFVWSSDTFHHAGSWWCVHTHCWVQPRQGAPLHCLHAASSTSQIPSPRRRSTQRDASLGESGSTYSVFVIFIFKWINFLPQDTFGQDFYLRRRQCLRAKTCILYRNRFSSSLLRVFFSPSLYLTT